MTGQARINLIFGTALIGDAGKWGVKNTDLGEAQQIVDAYFQPGYRELDTSKFYGEGTTEVALGKLKFPSDVVISTKVWPVKPGMHSAKALDEAVRDSLKKLGIKQLSVFYLHAPDRSVPFEESIEALDKLHKEGLFKEFGLSNYPAWEVAEIVTIAKERGWNPPTIYQGVYNATTRGVETELLPCIRKLGLRFAAYSPLAGGFLTGKIVSLDAPVEKGGRFDPDTAIGQAFRQNYFNEGYVNAVKHMKEVCEENGIPVPEAALRWLQHHSQLQPGDNVILGASSVAQLQPNISQSEKGPLPKPVIDVLDEANAKVGPFEKPYFK